MTIHPFQHTTPSPTVSTFSQCSSHFREIFNTIFRLRQGKLECVGEITLSAGVTTTVLSRKGISNQTVIVFDPKTANAAAELYGGTMYVLTANRGTDSWTITHANAGTTDRTFQYAAIG